MDTKGWMDKAIERMKKIISLIVFICLMVNATCIAENATEEYDFKKFNWGDSKAAILNVEGTPYDSGLVNGSYTEVLCYERTLLEHEVLLAYYFTDDQLYKIRYLCSENFDITRPNNALGIEEPDVEASWKKYRDVLSDFDSLLREKYGTPAFSTIDSLEMNIEDMTWGDTLRMTLSGIDSFYTAFLTERSYILLTADNGGEDIITIDYQSKDIVPETTSDQDMI